LKDAKEPEDGSTLVIILVVALLGMMVGSLMGPVLPALSDRFSGFGVSRCGDGNCGLTLGVFSASGRRWHVNSIFFLWIELRFLTFLSRGIGQEEGTTCLEESMVCSTLLLAG